MKRSSCYRLRSRPNRRVMNNRSENPGSSALHALEIEAESNATTVTDSLQDRLRNNGSRNGSEKLHGSSIQTDTSPSPSTHTEVPNMEEDSQQQSVKDNIEPSDPRPRKRRGRPSGDGKQIVFDEPDEVISPSFVVNNVNFIGWNTPFLVMLDNIITNRYPTFQDVITSMVPPNHPKLEGKSRTAVYGVIDVLVGNVLLKAGHYFNLEIKPFQSTTIKLAHFRRYKGTIQTDYQSYFQTVSQIRQKISSTPSVFWFLPPVHIFYIVGHVMSINGDSGSKEVDDTIGSILNKMGISERLTFTDIKSFVTIFKGFEKVDIDYTLYIIH